MLLAAGTGADAALGGVAGGAGCGGTLVLLTLAEQEQRSSTEILKGEVEAGPAMLVRWYG